MSDPDPIDRQALIEAVADLSHVMHYGITEEPCTQGCTHVIADDWTALGIANVVARRFAAAGLVIRPVDDDTRAEVEALLAEIAPHPCVYCKGTGWVEDEGWSHYPYGKGSFRERTEGDGYMICGGCDGGRELDIAERTEPVMVTDTWTREEQARAAELLTKHVLGEATDGE